MADVFNVEGDISVDNPIHENTGLDPEGAGGRALTASPVEQMAAALLAGVDDVSFWAKQPGSLWNLLVRMMPKGDAGLAELAGKLTDSDGNTGAPITLMAQSICDLKSASPEFKAELKQYLLGADRLKTHVHALYKLFARDCIDNSPLQDRDDFRCSAS